MRQFATVSISPWRLETPYNGAVNTAQNNYYTAASSPSAANTAQNYYTAVSSPSAANTAQNYYTAVSSPKQSIYRRIVAPPAPQFSHPGVDTKLIQVMLRSNRRYRRLLLNQRLLNHHLLRPRSQHRHLLLQMRPRPLPQLLL
jgi:hypothetical protein